MSWKSPVVQTGSRLLGVMLAPRKNSNAGIAAGEKKRLSGGTASGTSRHFSGSKISASNRGLSPEAARSRFYGLDRYGLVTESTRNLRPEQRVYARKHAEVQDWSRTNGQIGLLDVVRQARPSVLIGVSGQAGAFTEQAVREMAQHSTRPVIFPLSNPTSHSEAKPQDLMDWTDGRALIGTGTAFEPVNVGGKTVHIAQTNNSYIFPGLALGIVASKAKRVTDAMVKAAAAELIRHLPTQNDKEASLLPPLSDARRLGRLIGEAVGRQAMKDGQAEVAGEDALLRELDANIWEPVYLPYERKEASLSKAV